MENMIALSRLRAVIQHEIQRRTPAAIELKMPGEVLVLPADAEAVINELLVLGVDEVELIKCDVTYIVEQDFLYALTVEVK